MRRLVGALVSAGAALTAGCIDFTSAERAYCERHPQEGCEGFVPDAGGQDAGHVDAGAQDAGGGDAGGSSSGHVTVTVLVGDGGTTGRVEWMDGGLVCDEASSPCGLDLDAGTRLVVRGEPGEWGVLVGFAGCDTPVQGRCELTVAGDATIEATFDRPNLVFLTSATYPLGGFSLAPDAGPGVDAIGRADALCAAHAADAGLPGTFIAFVGRSSPARNPLGALGGARGWLRVDGKPAFDRLASGSDAAKLFYPLVLDEKGAAVAPGGRIATGMTSAGAVGNTCQDYTLNSVTTWMASGVPQMGGYRWFAEQAMTRCSDAYHLACFGIGRVVEVRIDRSRPARLAFVTSTGWRPDGGLAAADETCGDEAAELYGVDGGTFNAFLHPSGGGDAYSRLGRSPLPWARPDGVIVVPDADAFIDSPTAVDLQAPLANLASATYFWIGHTNGNCSEWTSSLGLEYPARGRPFDSGPNWDAANVNDGFVQCSHTMTRLACFER